MKDYQLSYHNKSKCPANAVDWNSEGGKTERINMLSVSLLPHFIFLT